MADHYHLTLSKERRDGTFDKHRLTVATEHADTEKAIATEMGYQVKAELCYDDCLTRSVSKP